MSIPSVYSPKTTEQTINRLNKLLAQTPPRWGKMDASQMLAHLNVSYDLAYGKISPRVSFFTKLMMKLFVKK